MTAVEQHDLLPSAKPRHVIDELDDAMGKDRTTRRKLRELVKPTPDKATVRVSRMNPGRLTGWGVKCSEHGTLGPAVDRPLVIPKRAGARAAALDHANRDHPEGATVLVEKG